MSRFAVICPESAGHFNPMSTLIHELSRRGHQVTWIGTLDGVDRATRLGIEAVAVAESEYPRGTLEQTLAELGKLSGWAAARFTLDAYIRAMVVILRTAPQAIRDCGATALITDETVFASRNIADVVGLPWITISNALCMHPDPDHPPMLPALKYRSSVVARLRNRLAQLPRRIMLRKLRRVLSHYRKHHGLPAYDFVRQNASELATIIQCPREFDYPRRNQPDWMHYVGALHSPDCRPTVDFPFERLDGRPLVYASMGTAQNRLYSIFRDIARACDDPSIQLVISLGGGGTAHDLGELPGDPVVVRFAPQLDLIRRAKLVITHAGMNTAMESIARGTPMVAIPITNDQPAVAARIAWNGCGEVISLQKVNTSRLSAAIQRVLRDDQYHVNAERLADANQRAGGARAAADIIARCVGAVSKTA